MHNFKDLKDSVESSYKALNPFRTAFLQAHKEYVGPILGDRGAGDRPINMIELGVTTYLQKLVPRQVQTLVLTHSPELRANAMDMMHAVNAKMQMMRLSEEFERVALGALLGVGLMKIGIREQTYMMDGEERLSLTGPYAAAISPTDWVHDVSATKFSETPYYGNKYSMSLADAKKNEQFDAGQRAKLQEDEPWKQEDKGPEGRGQDSRRPDEYVKTITLWDIYLPRENKIITFSASNDKPLREVDWEGPRSGPYLMAGFHPMLKNVLPNAPVNHWMAMNDLVNRLYEKCGQQASRQKTVGVAQATSKDDANRVVHANDGEIITVMNPDGVKELRFGGVDQNTLGFTINAQGWANYVQGNIDSIAGLGAASDTVGQEEIVNSQSAERVRSMQTAFVKFMKEAIRHVAFWMWKDPISEYQFTQKIPGTDVELAQTWPFQKDEYGQEVDARMGDFDENYQFDVEPFDMQDLTPRQRFDMIRMIWREDIMPLIELGLQPDMDQYMRVLSRYADLPELAEILRMPMGQLQGRQGGGGPTSAGGPPREYIHRNVSTGGGGGGQSQADMMQALMTAEA